MLIKNVHIFNGTETLDGLFDIHLKKNLIDRILPHTDAASDEIEILDGNEKWIMPGLIDLHVHLTWDGLVDPAMDIWHRSKEENMMETVANSLKYLKHGITSIRDLGSPDDDAIHVGRAIQRGWFPGPRIFAAGMSIIMTGGHDPFHGIPVDGPWEALKAVRTQVSKGCSVIKISATGGVYGRIEGEGVDDTELRDEELEMIMNEAHRRKVPVTAHAIGEQGVRSCLHAGIDCIEHGQFIQPDMAKQMAEQGTAYVPTLFVYKHHADNPKTPEYARTKSIAVLEHHQNALKYARENGVLIGTGSDAGSPNTPHPALLDEIFSLSEAGMTNQEILKAATSNAAKILWQEGKIGIVQEGAFADLLLLDKNPCENLETLKQIHTVIANGRKIIN